MTKLAQETVNEGCMAAYKRYAAMSDRDARLAFAYELQGFVKFMVDDQGSTVHTVRVHIDDLFGMLAKANAK